MIDSATVPSTNERVTGAFVKDMVAGVGVLTGKRSRYHDIFQAQLWEKGCEAHQRVSEAESASNCAKLANDRPEAPATV